MRGGRGRGAARAARQAAADKHRRALNEAGRAIGSGRVEVDTSSLEAGLEAVADMFRAALDEAADAMAESILDEADKRVPEDTGTLRRTGQTVSELGQAEASVRYGEGVLGGEDAPYAVMVHDRKGKGHHYLRDAVMDKHGEHLDAAAAVMKGATADAARRG